MFTVLNILRLNIYLPLRGLQVRCDLLLRSMLSQPGFCILVKLFLENAPLQALQQRVACRLNFLVHVFNFGLPNLPLSQHNTQ